MLTSDGGRSSGAKPGRGGGCESGGGHAVKRVLKNGLDEKGDLRVGWKGRGASGADLEKQEQGGGGLCTELRP